MGNGETYMIVFIAKKVVSFSWISEMDWMSREIAADFLFNFCLFWRIYLTMLQTDSVAGESKYPKTLKTSRYNSYKKVSIAKWFFVVDKSI